MLDQSTDPAFVATKRGAREEVARGTEVDPFSAGLAAVVHVSTLETALEAMAFGADGLVHVWRDEVVSEADARRFAEADIFVVPTLSVMVSAEDSAVAELGQETDEALLSLMQRQTLADRFRAASGRAWKW